MEYVIAVFKARSGTMKYYSYLKRRGIGASVIATPKSVGVSCGISVKIPYISYPKAKNLLYSAGIPGFDGFYLIKKNGATTLTTRI